MSFAHSAAVVSLQRQIKTLATENARLRMLSDRVRPDVEAAPWVVEQIKALEAENAAMTKVLHDNHLRFYIGSDGVHWWKVPWKTEVRR